MKRVLRSKSSQSGSSLVEYCLLISLISFVAIGSLRNFGAAVSAEYEDLAKAVSLSHQYVANAGGNGHGEGSTGAGSPPPPPPPPPAPPTGTGSNGDDDGKGPLRPGGPKR